MSSMPTERLAFKGELRAHNGWVTSIATVEANPDILLTASRDKSVIVWQLTREEGKFGYARRRLTGHSHYVEDVKISSDATYALTGSWDGTMRLWNIETGETTTQYVGHTMDVLSVDFSVDQHNVVSGSRDKTIRVWSIVGETLACYAPNDHGHNGWVSCVRFANTSTTDVEGKKVTRSFVISAGWDNAVKVWDVATGVLQTNFLGHTDYINSLDISPCSSFCATGGKDGSVNVWDLSEQQHMCTLDAGETVYQVTFSPVHLWVCAATASTIKIWDLETKTLVEELRPELPVLGKKATPIRCTSFQWSPDAQTLFAGYTDNVVRVFTIEEVGTD